MLLAKLVQVSDNVRKKIYKYKSKGYDESKIIKDNKSMAVPQAAQECHPHDTSTIRAFSQRAHMQRGASTTAQPLPQRAGENSHLRSARREI